MTDTQNLDAVRVGRGGVTLGWRSAASIVSVVFAAATWLTSYVDSRFDSLERAGVACIGLADEVASVEDSLGEVVIKLARLEERVDAGLPAGR